MSKCKIKIIQSQFLKEHTCPEHVGWFYFGGSLQMCPEGWLTLVWPGYLIDGCKYYYIYLCYIYISLSNPRDIDLKIISNILRTHVILEFIRLYNPLINLHIYIYIYPIGSMYAIYGNIYIHLPSTYPKC